MRRALVGLALLVALPTAAHADPLVFGTYVFEGCIENVSCHRAVVTTRDAGVPGFPGTVIDIELFSTFAASGSLARVLLDPLPNDTRALDQLGSLCRTTGDVRDVFQMTHPRDPFVPTSVRISVTHGETGLPGCFGPNTTILTLQQVLPTSAVPEPATMALVASGLVGVAAFRRRRAPWRKRATPAG